MITYRQVDASKLGDYAKIPMRVQIKTIFTLEKLDRCLGGILLKETPVEPYSKDFGVEENAAEYAARFQCIKTMASVFP